MSPPRMPRGGGPRFSEDTTRWALMFLGLVFALFFLLLLRLGFDHLAGRTVKFAPVRNPSGAIKAMLDEHSR